MPNFVAIGQSIAEISKHAMNMDSFQATTSARFCYISQKLASPVFWETDVTW